MRSYANICSHVSGCGGRPVRRPQRVARARGTSAAAPCGSASSAACAPSARARRAGRRAMPPRARASPARRGGPRSSRPSAIAAATAQPGSPRCVQSPKRHCAASASTSANTLRRPAACSHTRGSRSPGVSITSAPLASGTSSRCVVVWRPRSSPRRTGERRALLAGQVVEQRRLADARRAEQHRGAARPQPGRRAPPSRSRRRR